MKHIDQQHAENTVDRLKIANERLLEEIQVLRKLARQMRVNVQCRSRSPKWLVNTLDEIAKVQNIPEVVPGSTYGLQPKYETC